jgi:hypothetical protein
MTFNVHLAQFDGAPIIPTLSRINPIPRIDKVSYIKGGTQAKGI